MDNYRINEFKNSEYMAMVVLITKDDVYISCGDYHRKILEDLFRKIYDPNFKFKILDLEDVVATKLGYIYIKIVKLYDIFSYIFFPNFINEFQYDTLKEFYEKACKECAMMLTNLDADSISLKDFFDMIKKEDIRNLDLQEVKSKSRVKYKARY